MDGKTVEQILKENEEKLNKQKEKLQQIFHKEKYFNFDTKTSYTVGTDGNIYPVFMCRSFQNQEEKKNNEDDDQKRIGTLREFMKNLNEKMNKCYLELDDSEEEEKEAHNDFQNQCVTENQPKTYTFLKNDENEQQKKSYNFLKNCSKYENEDLPLNKEERNTVDCNNCSTNNMKNNNIDANELDDSQTEENKSHDNIKSETNIIINQNHNHTTTTKFQKRITSFSTNNINVKAKNHIGSKIQIQADKQTKKFNNSKEKYKFTEMQKKKRQKSKKLKSKSTLKQISTLKSTPITPKKYTKKRSKNEHIGWMNTDNYEYELETNYQNYKASLYGSTSSRRFYPSHSCDLSPSMRKYDINYNYKKPQIFFETRILPPKYNGQSDTVKIYHIHNKEWEKDPTLNNIKQRAEKCSTHFYHIPPSQNLKKLKKYK